MKAKIYTSTLLPLLLFSLTLIAQNKGSMEITFPVLGNCTVCQDRIESAVNRLIGIQSVSWDPATKVAVVKYLDTVMDAFQIMQAIAFVGHDTEWYPANDSAYNSLIGTCCEYERTNDYTNVQIGYLSLMGIWVSPLTGINSFTKVQTNVFPTAGHGIFHLRSGLASDLPLEAKVFSFNGQLLYSQKVQSGTDQIINIENLTNGQYLLVVSNKEAIVSESKLIKF